jgi:hypothetical protein
MQASPVTRRVLGYLKEKREDQEKLEVAEIEIREVQEEDMQVKKKEKSVGVQTSINITNPQSSSQAK